jgi:ABC-type thiamine transport system ATPase subunit
MPSVLNLLRIRNLALVEELEWQMGPGFIAVTGETGAGKSIIIDKRQIDGYRLPNGGRIWFEGNSVVGVTR